ncbi:MAG: cell division protein SepF [Defluviitaleaceae bacterium]|nr:cell division protein SepF [Defluviitaleaceae bacterium]
MSILNSLRNLVSQRGYDDDDYLFEDEFDNEDDDRYIPNGRYEEEPIPRAGARRSSSRDNERSRNSEFTKRVETPERGSRASSQKYTEKEKDVFAIHPVSELDIIVSEPLVFEDGPAICDLLKQRKPVIVNMGSVGVREAQRIMDFLAGAIYSVNGDLHVITDRIYIATPENVSVSDQTKEQLKQHGIFSNFFGSRQ